MRTRNDRSFPTFAGAATLAAALLFAAPAFAGGPLINCNPGQPYVWGGGGANIPFNPDQGDLGPLTNAQAVTLVGDSFQSWADIPTATATHVDAGLLPVDVDITNFVPFLQPAAPDGLSAIVFDDTGQIFDALFGPGSGVLGFAGPEWVDTVTCTIFEGVSFLNGPTFTDLVVAEDIMVHEFGHYQNLAHTVVNGQIVLGDNSGPTPNDTFPIPGLAFLIETMYPFYFGPLAGTSTPERDDIAFFSTLYPAAGFFADSGTISGSVLGPKGRSELTGVNVIARNLADPFVDAVSAISSDSTDDFSQDEPFVGTYTLNGLTPGADYAIYIDSILAGGFSTPPLFVEPEEFYSGAGESGRPASDDPATFAAVTAVAGVPQTGIDVLVNDRTTGTLPLGDDSSGVIFTPHGFQLCGRSYGTVFVNANGNLTFDFQDSNPFQSVPAFLGGQPRIAGLWTDFDPSSGGTISFVRQGNRLDVDFVDVPEFLMTAPNSFQLRLRSFGPLLSTVRARYGTVDAPDGIAGISCGGDATTGSETEVDLVQFTNFGIHDLGATGAVFEEFADGDQDLSDKTVKYFLHPF